MATNSFPHLPLEREERVNEKRPGGGFGGIPTPPDIPAHGGTLRDKLSGAIEQTDNDLGGFDERRLIRFTVDESFNADDLQRVAQDIELVSEEGETVVLGFASDAALRDFEARLVTLTRGNHVTYKQVLFALRSVDGWSVDDRTGWALQKYGLPETEEFMIDVELWPLEDSRQLQQQEWAAFEAWLQEQQIAKLDSIKQPGLTMYRFNCNADQVGLLLRHRDIRTVDLPPRFGLERALIGQDIQDFPEIQDPGPEAPGIVVLDSGLATGHPLLRKAVGEAKSFLPGESAADEHGHGTHVAGLALYGDVEACLRTREFIPLLRLHSGRILDRNNESTEFVENQISEAVRHFVNQHGCKVFNLSFGDQNKPYRGGHVRGLSVTLDTLSRELDVLFVVAAGNHIVSEDSPSGLAWREEYPDYLLSDPWRLIEPAPALNALTVGSVARHDRTANSQRYTHDPGELPIAKSSQPSPFTRGGSSVDGAIKPELIAPGGNWALNARAGHALLDRLAGLGVVSTCKDFAAGTPFIVENGTSMAAPQVAHLAASILREHPEADANLLRALLCANAIMPDGCQGLINDNKEFRTVCGYGEVNPQGLYRSLEDAATLIATETIENKQHHFYEVPIPQDLLSPGKRVRELVVALAYTPAVRTTRLKYKASRIDFRVVTAPDLDHVTTMFNKATDDADYENIKEFKSGTIGQQARSKGTVQADCWQFKQFPKTSKLRNEKLFVVITRNDFAWGENLSSTEEKYALVVSLRDRENEQAQLYTQIRARLEARLTTRVRV